MTLSMVSGSFQRYAQNPAMPGLLIPASLHCKNITVKIPTLQLINKP
jgi:hypothetical protein